MGIVAEVSKLLNDHEVGYEYIRWTEDELQEYVDDGLIQIALLRPDAFSKTIEVKLKPGAMQELPEGVTQLIDMVGTKDKLGRLKGKPLRLDTSASHIARNYFEDLVCRQSINRGDYQVKAYEFDPNNPHVFYVEPPVPPGEEVGLVLQGVVIPSGKEAVIPQKYHNAVIEWALYRAFGKDLESVADAQISKRHLEHFYSMLQLSQVVDDRVNKVQKGGT